MTFRVASVVHQTLSAYYPRQLMGNHMLRNIHFGRSFKPVSVQLNQRHYSDRLSRREERRVLEGIARQQNEPPRLPEPGTKEYQIMRNEISTMLKHGGKNPSIVQTSIDDGLRSSKIQVLHSSITSDSILDNPATKADIQELKEEMKKIEDIIEKFRIEMSQSLSHPMQPNSSK